MAEIVAIISEITLPFIRHFKDEAEQEKHIKERFDLSRTVFFTIQNLEVSITEDYREANWALVYDSQDDVDKPDALNFFTELFTEDANVEEFALAEKLKVENLMVKEQRKPYEFQEKIVTIGEQNPLVEKYFTIKTPSGLVFTTRIQNYNEGKEKEFFGNVFMEKEFGLVKGDYDFLHQIWMRKFPDEDYDWKQELQKRVDLCTPGKSEDGTVEGEPVIWRTDLETVIARLYPKEDEVEIIVEL